MPKGSILSSVPDRNLFDKTANNPGDMPTVEQSSQQNLHKLFLGVGNKRMFSRFFLVIPGFLPSLLHAEQIIRDCSQSATEQPPGSGLMHCHGDTGWRSIMAQGGTDFHGTEVLFSVLISRWNDEHECDLSKEGTTAIWQEKKTFFEA